MPFKTQAPLAGGGWLAEDRDVITLGIADGAGPFLHDLEQRIEIHDGAGLVVADLTQS